MKKGLILITGIIIGIGLSLMWQLRLYEPKDLYTDGSIESAYDLSLIHI